MKYSVVIPTYNLCNKYLKPCIDSMIQYTDMEDVELIVSANGCVDNTKVYLEYLKTIIPHLKVVWANQPLGFPKAVNEGIKLATTDKIILLNNDTLLLQQAKNDWLNFLEKPFLENPKCGITSSLKLFSPEAQRHFAVFFCTMIDRKVFNKIGLLNEEYGMGAGEDMEFSITAEEAGFEVIQCFPNKLEGHQWTSQFPIYHIAEGTMHNEYLVKGWAEHFKSNAELIAKKFGDIDVKESLKFLCENGREATAFYNEIIKNNGYNISKIRLKNKEVIDIGANMGTFSLFASKLGANKVIAVEPSTRVLDIFKTNIEKANINNIILKHHAVSHVTGNELKLALHDESGYNNTYVQSDNYETVTSITLKDILQELITDFIFLKMDCEGAEYDILLNADKKDMDRISHIAMEVHYETHPIHKGIHLINEKLKGFGFTLIHEAQIGFWEGINPDGTYINYRDIPFKHQHWIKQ